MNILTKIKIITTVLLSLSLQLVNAQTSPNIKTPLTLSSSEVAVVLSWTQNKGNINNVYVLEKSGDGDDWEQINTIRIPVSSDLPGEFQYADDYVRSGERYYYRLTVFSQSGDVYVSGIESIDFVSSFGEKLAEG